MSNKYTKLVKNTTIFAIGNFGSKILSFLIVPLYTYVLTTEEYGLVDLFSTSIGLLIPFFTLLISEALLRFVLGKEISVEEATSNSFLVFGAGTIVSLSGIPLYIWLFDFDEYMWMFVALIILNCFTQTFAQYFRSVERNVEYTINGIIVTAVTLGANVLFLLVFKWGLEGYLLSMVVAQLCSALFIIIKGKIFLKISLKSINMETLRVMLKYSIPLIPNSLMWGLMSAGDKYIINYFMGNDANGIYSLALKVPAVVNMVYMLFSQAWQLSAIEENKSEDKVPFYENVLYLTTGIMAIVAAGVIWLVKPVYLGVMSESFSPAWVYVPMLSIGTIISCSTSFYGVAYTLSKNTKKYFSTTMMGAIVNLMCSFVLIKPLGLHGVAIGTAIGYLVVAVARAKDLKIETGLNLDIVRTFLALGILIGQALLTISIESNLIYIIGFATILLLMFMYKREILLVLNKFLPRKGLK